MAALTKLQWFCSLMLISCRTGLSSCSSLGSVEVKKLKPLEVQGEVEKRQEEDDDKDETPFH